MGAPGRKRLELPAEEMRALGRQAVEIIVEHLTTLPDRPVARIASRAEAEAKLREPLPRRASPWPTVLGQVEADVLANVRHLDHPRFLALVPGPSNFVSVVADLLASGLNVFTGTWVEASGPAEVELVAIDWLREACGLPSEAGGVFVSGGSMANLTALAVARDTQPQEQDRRATFYFSDQTHRTVQRALAVLGFRSEQVRMLPSDDRGRLVVPALVQALDAAPEQHRHPICVVANAGTTNTGAIDPLEEIAAVCRQRGLWLHVDGAYGAAVAFSSAARPQLAGLDQADSITVDPHKWLFQPYEIGCLLVRDRHALSRCFRLLPEYMQDVAPGLEEVNFCDYGLQLSRRFNALKLWMSLKVFGADAFEEAIDHGIALAKSAEELLAASPVWEIVTPAQLGIVTFRFAVEGPGSTVDWLQQEIAARVIAEGYAVVTTTRFGGRTVLRICTINPRTTIPDVAEGLRRLERHGREASRRAGLSVGGR